MKFKALLAVAALSAALTAAFRKVTEIPGNSAFKLVHAEGPIKTRAAPAARAIQRSGARR